MFARHLVLSAIVEDALASPLMQDCICCEIVDVIGCVLDGRCVSMGSDVLGDWVAFDPLRTVFGRHDQVRCAIVLKTEMKGYGMLSRIVSIGA